MWPTRRETNDVTITANDGLTELTITDPGATISVGSGCLSVSPNQAKCSLDFEVDVEVRLGDGNDTLVLDYDDGGSGAFCAYFGGTGNDTILGGGSSFSSSEFLIGGPGNDALRGRVGDDTLKGGAGADVMSGGTSPEGRSLLSSVVARREQVWAVGDQGLGLRRRPLILRWDGVRFAAVATPPGFDFASVSANQSGKNLWAVGSSGKSPLAARCLS